MLTKYRKTSACNFGFRILFTSPRAPSIRRHITAATSGNQPFAVPPAKIDFLSSPPSLCVSSEFESTPAISIACGESLTEFPSKPELAVGDGDLEPR